MFQQKQLVLALNRTANHFTSDVLRLVDLWWLEKYTHRTVVFMFHSTVPNTALSIMKLCFDQDDVSKIWSIQSLCFHTNHEHGENIWFNFWHPSNLPNTSYLGIKFNSLRITRRCSLWRSWYRWIANLYWSRMAWGRSFTGQSDSIETLCLCLLWWTRDLKSPLRCLVPRFSYLDYSISINKSCSTILSSRWSHQGWWTSLHR